VFEYILCNSGMMRFPFLTEMGRLPAATCLDDLLMSIQPLVHYGPVVLSNENVSDDLRKFTYVFTSFFAFVA
jgi:hypothetical protein